MRAFTALIAAVLGIAAVVYGTWLIWPPAAWIVGGLAAVRLAVVLDTPSAEEAR